MIATSVPFQASSLTPVEFLDYFPFLGNWVGGPVNLAYRREAWRSAGGYAVQLPMCADYCLYVTLILHHGLEIIHERLASFHLHQQRFSFGIKKRRVNSCFELWLILRQARHYCRAANLPWPEHGVARGVAKQVKIDYWQPVKDRLKRRLRAR